MIDDLQLAHDLAIAKLCGSDLPTDKLVEQYLKYHKEIKSYLESKGKTESNPEPKNEPATIMSSPF